MDYKYDIFISYRRDELTLHWIELHFLPLLKHHIKMELDRTPTIFVDTQLEIGSEWPISLGKALGSSRIIVPLWTKTFFNSSWCTSEVAHMWEREKKAGFRTFDKPGGLIFPAIIHDGEALPVDFTSIQRIEIQDCYSVRMSVNSSKAEILEDKLRPLAIFITEAIRTAPPWQEEWGIDAMNSFYRTYYKQQGVYQTQIPKFNS